MNRLHHNREHGRAKSSGEWDSLKNAPKHSITADADGAKSAPMEADSYKKANLRVASNCSGEADFANAHKRLITGDSADEDPAQSARACKKTNLGNATNGLPKALVIAWNDQTTPPSAHSNSTMSGDNANSNEDSISPHQSFKACLKKNYHGVNFYGIFPQSKWNVIENKHETWNDRKNRAASATVDFIIAGLTYGRIIRRNRNNDYHYDSDASEDSYPRVSIKIPSKTNEIDLMSLNEKKFVLALPNCLPLDQGFYFKGNNNNAINFCPCGDAVTPWRDTHQVDVGELCKRKKRGGNMLTRDSLCRHLKDNGGEATRVSCMFHFPQQNISESYTLTTSSDTEDILYA